MKLDRLMGILTLLLQNDRITAPELAKRFEVNRRTIGRDIEALCQAGIPIVTYQGCGGGLSIAEGFRLDKSVLTQEELSSLMAALKGLGSVTEKSKLENTLDKLSSQAVLSLREPIIIDLASHYKGQLTEKITGIKQAIRESKLIAFDYYYEKGETRRIIEPYFILFQWSSWYVFGFCQSRQDWRMFKLLRLWNLSICDEEYLPRPIPEEKQNFNARFTDDIKLTALFERSQRYKLIETYGLDCYTETEQGLLLEIGFTQEEYMVNWLLGFGGKVKVIEPEYIAEALKSAAEAILKCYQ